MAAESAADAPRGALLSGPLQAGVAAVGGWRRLLLAFIMGAAAVAAFAPFHIIPALAPSFAVLVWLTTSSARVRDAAVAGLAFGLGHFVAGLYWISGAFMVVGGPAAIAAWPAVVGLSLFLALYPAAACAAYRSLVSPAAPFAIPQAVLFASLWTLSEWLRGWVLTGFPWNPVGSVWAASDIMLQVTSLVGVYGLGWATVFAASAFAGSWWQGGWRQGGWHVAAASVGVLLAVAATGTFRLGEAPDVGVDHVEDVRLRLVQPHIPQRMKWIGELRPRHVQDQVALSLQPGDADAQRPTHVIWAETAIPFYVNGDELLLQQLAMAVPPGGRLIAGGLRRDGGARYNSLFVIDESGRIESSYDKTHLVPFGEYMPLADLIPFRKLTSGAVDFTPGGHRVSTAATGVPPFQALICYEAIFPGGVVGRDGARPQWLLNVTNDAWYGISSGPHQHFALVRIRAVEEGLPVVRVANTGISAVVDPFGRVVSSLALGARGVIDTDLPKAAEPTVFSMTGNVPVVVACILVITVIRACTWRVTRVG